MGTTLRAEISKKNEYWIEKHRYHELKHFCLQYPIWKSAYNSLDGLSKRPNDLNAFRKTNVNSDPTAKCAEAKVFYSERINMIEQTAKEIDLYLADYIIKGVTEGLSYETINASTPIPCGKTTYYKLYREFFYKLNKVRK